VTPTSTYRVQVRPDFDLFATAGIVDYLAALGVTHLYASPLLQAAPGSSHGYDVVDFSRVNTELGSEKGRLALTEALAEHDMALVVDVVPNHCGIRVAEVNQAWWDVLAHGPASPYARWFDIDWSVGRIMLPVLGDEPNALDDLRVVDGELRYWEYRFPIAAGTLGGTPQQVHDRQHYRLISWRLADQVNYRRFFAINDLAAVRVEDPEVFEATHREVLRWYAAGELTGFRVDHPDGLRDPAGYFARLHDAAPRAWIVVEKILERGERLPDWPGVAGTTGYDALRQIGGLFIDPAGEAAFTALDTALTGRDVSWQDFAYRCKREVATTMLIPDVRRMARLVPQVPEAEEVLVEVLACFPVYRSYLPVGREYLQYAVTEAIRRRPDLRTGIEAVASRLADPTDELAARFQQTSGAVMAKGIEDTAFYRWTRFAALNEVGSDPERFGLSVTEFHAVASYHQRRYPTGMTTLSTHDTKWSEDVRARMAVLSEIPDEWASCLQRLMARAPLPEPGLAHLLWQATVGAWPLVRERLHGYAEKAAREARTATSWENPDAEFEQTLHQVVDRMYDDPVLNAELSAFVKRVTPYGWSNSLGQKLLQLMMPGVPDTYQGCELWDNSLVDPDNRRPVDFRLRRTLLARLDQGWLPPVDASGAVKLLVVSRALRLRRDAPQLFTGYHPLRARGPAADHLVAFDRGGAVALATRLPVGLERRGGWRDTEVLLPPGRFVEVLTGRHITGGPVALEDLFQRYPVALLTRQQA